MADKIVNATVKRWHKPYVQEVLAKCRQQGYKVTKTPQGYEVRMNDETNELFLRALTGVRDYLVSYNPAIFEEGTV